MKNIFLLLLLISFSSTTFSQTEEEQAVIEVIQNMFDAMRAGDSTALRKTFHPTIRLQSTVTDKEGIPKLVNGDIEKFIEAVGTPHDDMWDEKIWGYEVKVEDNLATAWTPYTFYVGKRMSHCGVNAFHLYKGIKGWKITQITDTRSKQDCQRDPTDEVNTLLDNWHKAAANADEDVFFGSMSEDAIYLGTDATERWERDEMKKLMKAIFERETAWDFKVKMRAVYLSDDKHMAWFEEALNTWMGECRGSGVVQKTDEGWKIKHYNLALAVPNDKMDGVMKLIDPNKKSKR